MQTGDGAHKTAPPDTFVTIDYNGARCWFHGILSLICILRLQQTIPEVVTTSTSCWICVQLGKASWDSGLEGIMECTGILETWGKSIEAAGREVTVAFAA
jgi:hypothetical protein